MPLVFHRNGKSIRDYYTGWRAACRRADLPDRKVHDFRRTATNRIERAEVSRSDGKGLTGHKSDAAYTGYTVTNMADLREAQRKVAALDD